MVIDGKRITTQDLNYTILKRQYMYAPLQHREQHLLKAQAPKYRPAPKRASAAPSSKPKTYKSKYGKENANPQGAAPQSKNFNPGSKAPPNKPHVTERTQDSITIEWDLMESAVHSVPIAMATARGAVGCRREISEEHYSTETKFDPRHMV